LSHGQRIGVYGGAFDPPHAAHVAVARAAIAQLALNRLIVLPTGQAWHKPQQLSAAAHRVAMAQAAFGGLPGAEVDDRETRRAGASYTIDTLKELQAEHPGADWFLVIGADQAQDFERWNSWQQILSMVTLAVAPRGATEGGGSAAAGAAPAMALPASLCHAQRPVARLTLPPLPHRATSLRERLVAGMRAAELAEDWLPGAVARYIDHHHLYSET
jgi:nicotinate-nucleotide adenylyltransferase